MVFSEAEAGKRGRISTTWSAPSRKILSPFGKSHIGLATALHSHLIYSTFLIDSGISLESRSDNEDSLPSEIQIDIQLNSAIHDWKTIRKGIVSGFVNERQVAKRKGEKTAPVSDQ